MPMKKWSSTPAIMVEQTGASVGLKLNEEPNKCPTINIQTLFVIAGEISNALRCNWIADYRAKTRC